MNSTHCLFLKAIWKVGIFACVECYSSAQLFFFLFFWFSLITDFICPLTKVGLPRQSQHGGSIAIHNFMWPTCQSMKCWSPLQSKSLKSKTNISFRHILNIYLGLPSNSLDSSSRLDLPISMLHTHLVEILVFMRFF